MPPKSTSIIALFALLIAFRAAPAEPAAPAPAKGHEHHDHDGHDHGPSGPVAYKPSPGEKQLTDDLEKLQQTPRKTEAERTAFLAAAEKLLRRLASEFPSSPRREDYSASLANLLARSDRLADAKAFWVEYMKGLEDERLLYNAHRFFADMLAELETSEAGQTVLRGYLKAHSGNRFESEVRVALARMQAAGGDPLGAADTLAKQLELHPTVTPEGLRLEMNRNRINGGQADVARKDLEAMRADSKLAAHAMNVSYLLGFSHESLGATTAALAEYETLVASPAPAVASQGHLAIAELWQKLGDGPRAVAAMGECLAKLPAGAAEAPLKEKLAQLGTIGKPAPALSVPGPDGKTIELARYQGKFLLIDFWATWCAPCVKALPALKRLVSAHRGPKLEVLGISLDEKPNDARVADFVKRNAVDWTISVPGQAAVTAVCGRYGVSAIPHVVLVDPAGKIYTSGLDGQDLELALRRALEPAK